MDTLKGAPPLGAQAGDREFERLRAWRLGQAQGKPAFTVAADAVLSEVLRRRPRSTGELIEIRGIGPAFCEKHGESLLAELTALEATGGGSVQRASSDDPPGVPAALASGTAPT